MASADDRVSFVSMESASTGRGGDVAPLVEPLPETGFSTTRHDERDRPRLAAGDHRADRQHRVPDVADQAGAYERGEAGPDRKDVAGGVGGRPVPQIRALREAQHAPLPREDRRRRQVGLHVLRDGGVLGRALHVQGAPPRVLDHGEVVRGMPTRRLVLLPTRRHPVRPDRRAAPVLDRHVGAGTPRATGAMQQDGRGGLQECAAGERIRGHGWVGGCARFRIVYGPMTTDSARTRALVQQAWDGDIVPALTEYIRIPAKSPMYDTKWAEHGHIDQAVTLMTDWARKRKIEGLTIEVVRLEGRTPVILMEVPGQGGETVLLYGHCDKQPEMVGWAADGGPWTPVRRGDRLFGRGAGDDGYASFAALTAIETLQAQGIPHARCVVLIEAPAESGSPDLHAYVEKLPERLRPDLVICLDSGCGDYDHLWATTSLRGILSGTLTVEVLGEGVHSGAASGIVPSSFRILRQVLDRLEDDRTGRILVSECHVEIPPGRIAEVRAVAGVLGGKVAKAFPLVPGMRPVTEDPVEALLNNTWRPMLAVTGVDGMPALADAGNVLRPKTAVKLSLRLPPTADADAASRRAPAGTRR